MSEAALEIVKGISRAAGDAYDGAMDENGEDTSLIRKYINAALNDDWKTIKGSEKKYLDSIKDTVI